MKRTLLAVPLTESNQKQSDDWCVVDLHSGNFTEIEGSPPEPTATTTVCQQFRDSLEAYLRGEYLL